MWVVIVFGLAIEIVAIIFAVSEDGLLFYSWIASLFAAVIVRFAFFGGGYSYSFWGILILFLIISHSALAIKLIGKNQKAAALKRKQEKEKDDLLRREKKEREDDERRIAALIPIILNGRKYPAFKKFLSQNISSIARVTVNSGVVTVLIPKSGRLFIPNYKIGKLVIDDTYGFSEYTFFGTSLDERDWTIFEKEALARIVDQCLKEYNCFQIIRSAGGFTVYDRIAPDTEVVAKNPY
jgi:hypothetical protein